MAALLSAGPGWAAIGGLKLLAGSFLADLAFKAGARPAESTEPTRVYAAAYTQTTGATELSLGLTTLFVAVS